MNAKAIVPLAAGLVVGGLALKLGLTKLNSASGAQVQTVQVWTARSDIPRGSAIDETMIETVAFPAKSLPEGVFKADDKEKLLRRVPRMGAPAKLPILESMLLAEGEHPGIFVPEGLRAVAVKVDESAGVGRHLLPGAFVDVVGFFNVRTEDGKAATISRTILENVEVAAVGERITAETAPSDPNAKSSKSNQPKPATAVTLLVKPEAVPVLHLAEQQGKLKLSMRGKADAKESARRTVFGDEVLGNAKPKPPAVNPFAAFFGSKKPAEQKPQAAPQQTAQPTPPTQPQAPSYKWVMRVVNGSRQETLGWRAMNSLESERLAVSNGGNDRSGDRRSGLPGTNRGAAGNNNAAVQPGGNGDAAAPANNTSDDNDPANPEPAPTPIRGSEGAPETPENKSTTESQEHE